jgi:hypothetical protein
VSLIVDGQGGGSSVASADITDSTSVGRAVLTATDAATARTAIGVTAAPRALGNPIQVSDADVLSPAIGSGGSVASSPSPNAGTLSSGVPAGATYAVVWLSRLIAGTSGVSCTVDRLVVTDASSWAFNLWWLNSSGVTTSAEAATARLKIYWY